MSVKGPGSRLPRDPKCGVSGGGGWKGFIAYGVQALRTVRK